MANPRSERALRTFVSAMVIAGVGSMAAWASVADNKSGWAVLAASVAAVAGTFGATLLGRVWRASGARVSLLDAVNLVGDQTLSQIKSSSLRMRLYRPMPMRVRFRSAEDVGATRRAVIGVPGMTWQESPLAGHVGEIAQELRTLPWQQLVVVGEPGAGKTVLAMLLVEQLLTQRQSGEPVPVLLGASSWRPEAESLIQFVSRRLTEDFGLNETVAKRLATEPRMGAGGAAAWWVMPVLDGLDELDTSQHVHALRQVDRFAAADRPVVVTCRKREFKEAEV